MVVSAADYLPVLQAIEVPGQTMPVNEPDSVFNEVLLGLAEEMAALHNRAEELIGELDPRTTFECIYDWVRVTGLPDSCTTLPATLQGIRDAVVTKLNAVGGQSKAYFIALAAAHGYTITIDENRPFTAGSRAGDRCNNAEWRYVFVVNAPEETIAPFRAGSRSGERLASWGNDQCECLINTYKPAHTRAQFNYG
ncbi:MAG: DUF2313 domain-containing protein [Cyanobacteria bacterium HKST-UBA05]|nr:DUF2313 domain-containing protein [Cyanobacteria bacterium HKST-UBA05]